MGYNKKQQDVLDYKFSERKHNLLVSAAAGSGKTRVLVDKIYDIIAKQSDIKTSLSRMLVMTFTIKATYEMKSRLKERFENEIKMISETDKSPETEQTRERIIREASTIQNANITTIDAFCKKILEENYLELNKDWSLYKNFDPSYKIADAKELSILYDNVLDDLLENEVYANKDKYKHFIKSFFKKNGDGVIKKILLDGLDFLSSLAWPVDKIDKWLKEIQEKEKELKEQDEFNENEKICLELLKLFYIRVVEEKVKRNIYAISDYASMTLDILYDDVNGEKVESKFVKENIKSKYDYIFVDEYQDTNTIQECLLNAVSNGKNVFMVGDVKQSIYGFRNANPEIFTQKFKDYGKNKGGGELITMDINYRSHYPVLNYVNELFGQIMKEDFGDINYEKDGQLGLPTKENTDLKQEILDKKKNGKPVEIYVIYDKKFEEEKKKIKGSTASKENEEATDNKTENAPENTKKVRLIELEAEFVANKIEELKSEGYKYKDMVILLRNAKTNAEHFLDALSRHNIPSYADLKKGFFNRQEIKLMVDVLNVIDNPRQDIPLANVLTSNIVGLNNSQMAILKYLHLKTTGYNKTSLCDDVEYAHNYFKYINLDDIDDIDKVLDEENENKKKNIDDEAKKKKAVLQKLGDFDEEKFDLEIIKRKNELDEKLPTVKDSVKKFVGLCKNYNDVDFDELASKLNRFVALFEEFRFKARYIGISELINLIYDKTAIKSIMLAMNDGLMRNANLDVLYETARSYENSSFVGLFNFMRYIERIKDLNDDQGLAKVSDEYDDVVRVMSIHSSKGLEFKCVILANATSRYNTKAYDKNVPMQFDSEDGVAMDYYDLEKGYCIETEKKKNVISKKIDEDRKEEMRVLYVALTRAEERLIITGATQLSGGSHLTFKKFKEIYDKIEKKEKSDVEAKDCTSFMELILTNYIPDSQCCKFEKKDMELVLSSAKKEDQLTVDIIEKEIDEIKKNENEIKSKAENHNKQIENKDLNVTILDKLDKNEVENSIKDDYAFADYQLIDKTKMSVSDIKKELHDERIMNLINKNKVLNTSYYDDSDAIEAGKNKKEKNDGTEIGNAYHRYMQFYNYTENKFDGEVGNAGDDWIKKVSEEKIKKFLKSDIGKEMAEACESKNLYREQKFMKLFSIDDINKYGDALKGISNNLDAKILGEKNITIQGIIDAFYIKEDTSGEYIVLVDYKTDGISKDKINEENLEANLVADYAVQLQIYADALENLTGLEVKKKYIYSFALDKEIEI